MRGLVSGVASVVSTPRHAALLARSGGGPEQRETRRLIGAYVRKLALVADSCDIEDHDGQNDDPWVCCSKAMLLLEEMREQDVPITPHARITAMRACAGGRLDVVEELFSGLVADGAETEASYAALIVSRVAHGELSRAAAALDALLVDARFTPKLRSCSPLLTGLCDTGTMEETAVRLWERLARRGVEFTPVEYEARMRMHARSGATGPLASCLSDLLGRFPTPDAATVASIEAALSDCAEANVLQGASPPPEGAVEGAVEAARAGAYRVGVLDASGRCECSGQRLRLLGLSGDERERVRDVIVSRAASRSSAGLDHLQEYREWLRVREPFDYVLDGPNVAYLDQNYPQGAFRYRQIQLVIDELRNAEPDCRILLLLPQKYLQQVIPAPLYTASCLANFHRPLPVPLSNHLLPLPPHLLPRALHRSC